ncbi:MAG TPA: NAD(P)/FAD-dependent oxidoreductase [Methanoregulaceae archaeon]|nr:NAD(P)/FAD-dependent oxidoreductase [Methanoregulaceae archaeon]
MKVCIIGGGLTGLVAAHRLGSRHEVELYEKKDHLGGCLSSYHINDYWLEKYYHHCFAGDTDLFLLMEDLRIHDRLEWLKGTTGYYSNKTIYPLSSPLEILRYPELSLAEKARLGMLVMSAKKMDATALDTVTARDFIMERLGGNIYRSFFEPLLTSKFGEGRNEVSAAWLISRISIRSNRGLSGERLGYLKGGFQVLIDGLERSIGSNCVVRVNDPVISLQKDQYGWRVNGRLYDTVLSTIPPHVLGAPGDTPSTPLPYQGAACMALGLDRDVTEGIYWLNMKDPAPYGAVVSHTNFIPKDRYGEHIVYLASYFSGKMPEKIDTLMLGDFCTRFQIPESAVLWHRLAVEPLAGPVYTTGYRSLIPEYSRNGLYFAGMFSRPNYPERSMNGSVIAGNEVTALIDKAEET